MQTIFETLTGLRYTQENIIGLILFFGLGYLFGKLTRRVGIVKGFFVVVFGLYFYYALKDTYGVVILAFVLGILANHSYLYIELFQWAQSIGDVFFALRYRRAYEDMRRREAEFEAQARAARAEAYARARAQGESDRQRQWREATGTSGTAGGNTGGKQQTREPPRPGGSNVHEGLRAEYLRTMGLDPNGEYTAQDLKKAYHRQAKRAHPDAGGSAQEFRDLTSRYEWLRGTL